MNTSSSMIKHWTLSTIFMTTTVNNKHKNPFKCLECRSEKFMMEFSYNNLRPKSFEYHQCLCWVYKLGHKLCVPSNRLVVIGNFINCESMKIISFILVYLWALQLIASAESTELPLVHLNRLIIIIYRSIIQLMFESLAEPMRWTVKHHTNAHFNAVNPTILSCTTVDVRLRMRNGF